MSVTLFANWSLQMGLSRDEVGSVGSTPATGVLMKRDIWTTVAQEEGQRSKSCSYETRNAKDRWPPPEGAKKDFSFQVSEGARNRWHSDSGPLASWRMRQPSSAVSSTGFVGDCHGGPWSSGRSCTSWGSEWPRSPTFGSLPHVWWHSCWERVPVWQRHRGSGEGAATALWWPHSRVLPENLPSRAFCSRECSQMYFSGSWS